MAEVFPVTPEDLSEMTMPAPFGDWAWEMMLGGKIDLFVQALVQSGEASSKPEALDRLSELSKRFEVKNGHVSWGDLANDGFHYALFSELENLLGMKRARHAEPFLSCGVLGHKLMAQLFAREEPFGNGWADLEQMTLFSEERSLPLFESAVPLSHPRSRRFSTDKALARVDAVWAELCGRIAVTGNWADWYHVSHREVAELYASMTPFLSEYLAELNRKPGVAGGYVAALSVMTWVTALHLYLEAGPRPYFPELRLFDPSIHGLGGGRLDALEVTGVRGKPPTASQKRMLRQMSRHRFGSLTELLRDLLTLFGAGAEVKIRDWKFAIGDGPHKLIVPEDVAQAPFPKHAEQMRRYLTFASVSNHLAGAGELWSADSGAKQADLVYLLPTVESIEHRVGMAPSDKERAFLEWVVKRWGSAERRSSVRHLNGALGRYLVRLLSGKADGRKKAPVQPSLMETDLNGGGKVVSLVDRHRFLDENRIIERRPEGRLFLHLDHLIQAIESGRLDVGRGFNLDRGGLIRCPMPGHADPGRPSCSVRLDQGSFHCFGCNASGWFDPRSVPPDFDIDWSAARRVGGSAAMFPEPFVPSEHHGFMSLVQELLRSEFGGGAGARYLREERGLDPDLAREHGAGFGGDVLIHGLLDAGRDVDELIQYGILGLSPRMLPDYRLPRLLARWGFGPDDLRRPIPSARRNAEPVYGLPYSVLEGRVTFPLTYDGKITNFYGRSIRKDSPVPHRKLSTAATGVLHGGFNMEILRGDGRELFVAEAVIDALTLIQTGRPSLALIGVDNSAILREAAKELAVHPKEVVLVLDADEAGQKASERVAVKLRSFGFNGSVRNGTAEVVPPGFDDVNKWWVEAGRMIWSGAQ